MRFKILSVKDEGQAVCNLIESSLEEYVSSLPQDYASYDVQRGIISNSYLDKLVLTVLNKSHIPAITLVLAGNTNLDLGDISDFRILDGLQRTHRLKIICDTKKLLLDKVVHTKESLSEFQLKKKYRDELVSIGSSSYILIELKKFYDVNGELALKSCFTDNYQWFEVWSGLGPTEQVEKMLLLNAGHKPVNIRHQLELLFNNMYSSLTEVKIGKVVISREKEISSTSHSKQRSVGEFHFSHIISSLISYVEKKPVSTNSDFIEKIQSDKEGYADLIDRFDYEFLQSFVKAIYSIDLAAAEHFGDIGIQWMGRDTSLTALFSALGSMSSSTDHFVNECSQLVKGFSGTNLSEYLQARKTLDLAKVNIGGVSKRVIFKAFVLFAKSDYSTPIDWVAAFEEIQ
ncbi:hypothetical protein KDX30_26150 [Pseudomonas sp. CDFA 553]|uniref:hypothetical protein n=1 Tax=Pseudomonas quasicaspiana TaxID=2829821 RepID=UPI001E593740|nr:hypothetical protein [Pseudomonas quasicaspiana]MCD5991368.1 hypothetical protein [Pseudomonas quasicaspiana]